MALAPEIPAQVKVASSNRSNCGVIGVTVRGGVSACVLRAWQVPRQYETHSQANFSDSQSCYRQSHISRDIWAPHHVLQMQPYHPTVMDKLLSYAIMERYREQAIPIISELIFSANPVCFFRLLSRSSLRLFHSMCYDWESINSKYASPLQMVLSLLISFYAREL